MNTRKPHFFLIGAPKCGTTSMYAWLKSHPRIFIAPKEAHHFNTDHADRIVPSSQAYQALFEGVSDRHIAVGEASVRYLYSHEAVANILRYNKESVFIVMLRNPVEMAYSWHNQLYYSGDENVADFETAWNLQAQRRAGKHIPPHCRDIKKHFYSDVCRLGEQVQRLYQQVPSDRVHVVVFDDLTANPGPVYRSVLNFLNVPDDHRQVFEMHNPAKITYSLFLRRSLSWLGFLKLGRLKNAMGISRKFGIRDRIWKYNEKAKRRPPLSPHMRHVLAQCFYDDVRLLERLLGRDFTHWIA